MAKKKSEYRKSVIISDYISAALGLETHYPLPKFDKKILPIRNDSHNKKLLYVFVKEDNTCSLVTADVVAAEIQRWFVENYDYAIFREDEWYLGSGLLKDITRVLERQEYIEPIAMPPIIGFCDEHNIVFNRMLDISAKRIKMTASIFNSLEEAKQGSLVMCPTWVSFLSRMDNTDAFCMFVWSLFEPDADISQYIWLHGEGGSGKSTIVEAIGRLFGNGYCTAKQFQFKNKFFYTQFIGRRLCQITEADPTFPGSDVFKSITGDRRILVEPKGKDHYEAEHACKFIFTSNERLNIRDNEAEKRRAIYCHIKEYSGELENSENIIFRLHCELQNFLIYCYYLYKNNVNVIIPTCKNSFEDLIDDTIEGSVAIFENNFVYEEGMLTKLSFVTKTLSNYGLRDNREKSKFYEDICKKFGVKKFKDKGVRYLLHCKPKNDEIWGAKDAYVHISHIRRADLQ